MDDVLKRRQSMNSFIFKSSLERIIDKYSKLQYQDGDVEVDLDSITTQRMSTNDSTGLTVSSLDESQRNVSETEVQPEDGDEVLEMSLRSHGSSLLELYPDMISRIGRACRRQNVSEAADSVRRRYRRWPGSKRHDKEMLRRCLSHRLSTVSPTAPGNPACFKDSGNLDE